MTAQMSVRFILALTMQIYLFACLYTNISLSAGIGRQCELKIRWFNIVNVQVVSWIFVSLVKGLVHWQILWYNSRFTFSGLFNGFEISVVLIYSRKKRLICTMVYVFTSYFICSIEFENCFFPVGFVGEISNFFVFIFNFFIIFLWRRKGRKRKIRRKTKWRKTLTITIFNLFPFHYA